MVNPAETIGMDAPVRPGETLLEVRDLQVEFRTMAGVVRAVNGISYTLSAGQTLAILGESGSGKTVSSLATLGLLETPPAVITGGQVLYRGTDLLSLSESEMRTIRGAKVAMIFQDALSSLNPVFPVGEQIAEMFRMHLGVSHREGRRRAVQMLDQVRIPMAKDRANDYPHQFSGGMRQRVMIAVAIALRPEVLIADEPTTALDVTVQAQILELLKTLQEETGMGLILITHDLGVVAEVADDVAVMYAGRIVEKGPIHDVFSVPAHPYALGLLRSVASVRTKDVEILPIPGQPPNLARIPAGCPFSPRCAFADASCYEERPELASIDGSRAAACHHLGRVREVAVGLRADRRRNGA